MCSSSDASKIVDGLNAIEGFDLSDAGWRVLRLAQRHRSLSSWSARRTARSCASDCSTRPGWPSSPTSTSARQVEGEGEHIRFSYASSFEAIDEGLSRIVDFMAKNKQ